MNDVSVIDRFLDVFSRYIDSGFGLLQGEVAFLTATLIVIDMTLAGLFWAMGHASGQGEDVIAKLIRKVMRDKNVDSAETLLKNLVDNGAQLIACHMSMDVMGIRQEELINGIELGGVAAFLGEAEESGTTLFI